MFFVLWEYRAPNKKQKCLPFFVAPGGRELGARPAGAWPGAMGVGLRVGLRRRTDLRLTQKPEDGKHLGEICDEVNKHSYESRFLSDPVVTMLSLVYNFHRRCVFPLFPICPNSAGSFREGWRLRRLLGRGADGRSL